MSEIISKENELIVVRQLPVIEDQLLAVKSSIEERVTNALSLVCTEDTYKEIKKVRSDLNKEYTELEKRRKSIKAQILEPYERFESVYKECAGDLYANADKQLRDKISEVETGLKAEKEADVKAYFYEYCISLGIEEDINYSDSCIKVGLSDSRKSLHEKAKDFADRIKADLEVIGTLAHGDETLVEYRKNGFNLTGAMLTVENRHKLIEAEKARKEAARAAEEAAKAAAQKVQEAATEGTPEVICVPVVAPVESAENPVDQTDNVLQVTFTVYGTIAELKALKQFLFEGGYRYEE